MNAANAIALPQFSPVEDKIARSLRLPCDALSPVDFDRLYLSEAGLRALHHLARTAGDKARKDIRAGLCQEDEASLSLHAHRVEDSQVLVVSAVCAGRVQCVQIPGRHWMLRPDTVQ